MRDFRNALPNLLSTENVNPMKTVLAEKCQRLLDFFIAKSERYGLRTIRLSLKLRKESKTIEQSQL